MRKQVSLGAGGAVESGRDLREFGVRRARKLLTRRGISVVESYQEFSRYAGDGPLERDGLVSLMIQGAREVTLSFPI